ncbi:MAG: hypothetical protein ACFFB2_17810 [Promethearchaeota archaeon]
MDNIQVKSIENTSVNHSFPDIFSDFFSTITSNEIITYLRKKREEQRILKEISLSDLFSLHERYSSLNTISYQVHISETIELIEGRIVSSDINQYRGLLLNIERAMSYFYLFYWIFRFFKYSNATRISLESYSLFRRMFEHLWQIQYPWDLIRPARISRPLNYTETREIQKIVTYQQKKAWQIAKFIEKKGDVKESLKEVEILPHIIKSMGITGPIARISGNFPLLIPPSSVHTRRSAQLFLKYAYSNDNNLLSILKISYAELILALNRISQLLGEFPIESPEIPKTLVNGEATTSFETVFGKCHLTINISDNKIIYYNFIPPQMTNLTGFLEILSTTPVSLKPIFLLLFDPEISLKVK